MAVDLRTELNACDNITGFIGDGPVDVDNTAGFVYQGTNAITTQHSNTDEHIYTTSIGGTRDLSDSTCYLIVKDNLVETAANGGIQYVIGDGTDRIGFGVGGNDDVGMALDVFWNTYKLDVTERANAPYNNVYAGVLANLTVTAITSVGLGTVHLAKAQGNVDNIKLDRFAFHTNGSYALRVNGGTIGTPETMVDVLSDSITNGVGLIANPFGSAYTFYGPTEWGEPAANADSYFSASDEQWIWIGGDVGATHFPFRVVGNATDTISFTLDAVSITNVGTRAQFDMSDANVDTLSLTAVNFTDVGAITFPANTVNKNLDACLFNNCDQVYLDDISATDLIFNGTTDALGAILLDTAGQTTSQTDLTFNSDGTGHAIYITTAGTYNLSGWSYNGYGGTPGTNGTPSSGSTDAVVYNNSGGLVTINVSGGDSPSVRNGASSTTTVNNTVAVTLTGLKDDTEVAVYNDTTGELIDEAEPATDGTAGNRSFTFSSSAGTVVYITVFNLEWLLPPLNRINNFTVPSANTSIPITQIVDRNYNNP